MYRVVIAGIVWLGMAVGLGSCQLGRLSILAPEDGLLTGPGALQLRLALSAGTDPAGVRVQLDGQPLAISLAQAGDAWVAAIPGQAPGTHALVVTSQRGGDLQTASSHFEVVVLDRPDECDVLQQVECVLPFPSSRFLEPAPTETGWRVAFGPTTLPRIGGQNLDPTPYRQNDGFSPTAQVLMHFPGVDLAASGAPRLDPQTRTYGTRGLSADSPTLLIEWQSGERVNHWLENDDRATDPSRVLTFLRPGESLQPGKRYIVAVRRLKDAQGAPIPAEPVFAAIRDGRPSDLPAVEQTRERIGPVLRRLDELGVDRGDLILAFDFVVQSDPSLTRDMLSMRDQAFAWVGSQLDAGVQTFSVTRVVDLNPGCADPTQPIWRFIEGTFQVPLFLDRDPFIENTELGFLKRGADGRPTWSSLTDAPFGISIPCAALQGGGVPSLLIGHGLFGTGASTVEGLTQQSDLGRIDMVAGGTNWSGLSAPDTQPSIFSSFIFKVLSGFQADALADRLRQGQTNTLVLARMLRRAAFNLDPAFQDATGRGALRDGEVRYFGASLGGIMGTMFAALTPDATRLNVDVPAINFSLLLQRATPFIPFDQLLDVLNPDAMDQAIGISLIHEIWVRGEPAGYATHVTSHPLPGSIPKQILMSVALFDQQVTNLGAQLSGRTLRLPVLEGSVVKNLPGMPDVTGPQESGYIVYDTGSFDVTNPAHLPFIPPLVNRPAVSNRCDPHTRQGFIPASIDQLKAFLDGLGILNFCTDDGVCNASEPGEIPFGDAVPCDPLG